jgi:hypothetical protein
MARNNAMNAILSGNPSVSQLNYHIFDIFATAAHRNQEIPAQHSSRSQDRDCAAQKQYGEGQIGGVKMKKHLSTRLMVIALLSIIVFSLSATAALAAGAEPVAQSEPVRLDGGDPDNDLTPKYGPDGQLIYPIFNQGPAPRRAAARSAGAPKLNCLERPVADGRYGDVRPTDSWARVEVERCGDTLAGVAWSRWPGRNPIDSGHDRQNLLVSVEVVDLTAGKTVETLERELSNNPRAQGVLFFTYGFELPADGHEYELNMTAKMRQNVCGNGSGSATDSASGSTPLVTVCNSVEALPSTGSEISAAGTSIELVVDATNATEYWLINHDTGESIAGPQASNRFSIQAYPNVNYAAMVNGPGSVSTQGTVVEDCTFSFEIDQDWACALTINEGERDGTTLVEMGAVDEDGRSVNIDLFRADSNFSYRYAPTAADTLPVSLRWPGAKEGSWFVQFEVSADDGQTWSGGAACRLEEERDRPSTGQYQDFIGPVAFGTFTPVLEPGKEYFDGPRSVMYNVEYVTDTGQGDVVFRLNGQEMSAVTSSIFNPSTFRKIESVDSRSVTTFNEGTTKLIAYQYGAEQARIFQTVASPGTRWIHPLDQPFEHKYQFVLELHGPPNVTDLLVYGDELREVRYDQNGVAVVDLTYSQPGLVAIYPEADVPWLTVDTLIYASGESVSYRFSETDLYHYRIVDSADQVVPSLHSSPDLEFSAEPGVSYQAQLAYPATSLFVGLYDDMQFEHTPYWTMPIDGRTEHDFEFHLDYHRLDDPNLENGHIRGDVLIDALYLINGTTSVAQQFPYGRHDGALPGVTIVGIPNVSMVAFCQRPGVHEVVYWGGWENEAYYLPERGWAFDQELYDEWTEDQRGDCIDAARRVNMMLAREGLRTDHTYRHHGERSQGYQMSQLHIWSPYNLAGMRAPHLGQLLKPGTVLTYYEDPEHLVFWGWDLESGGLAQGVGAAELKAHISSLGAVEYVDQTGIHPAQDLN